MLSQGLESIFETVTAEQICDCGSALFFDF